MAAYKTAIQWIAQNDDTEWIDGDPDSGSGAPSVTACLVADLFGKTTEAVRVDIKKNLERCKQ